VSSDVRVVLHPNGRVETFKYRGEKLIREASGSDFNMINDWKPNVIPLESVEHRASARARNSCRGGRAGCQRGQKPYPRRIGEDKLLVWGAGRGGRLLQIILVMDDDGTVFVIHGRELTNREKGRYRRNRR
jgi:hypothetical protein